MHSKPTLAVVLAAQFVIPMSIAGTAIALPEIAADLGESPGPLQWVVNGFNLAFALFTVVWGATSDRIGHHLSFRIGVALTGLAGIASAAAPNLPLLDGARVLAGIGAAAVLVGATSILSNIYTGTARATAFAAFGTVNGLGLALGPSIAGVLVGGIGWRGVFLAQAVVLAAAFLGTLTLPAVRTDRAPGLDLGLLRNRRFLGLCLVPVAGAIGFVTLLTYLPGALSGIGSMSAGPAGLFMLAMTIPVLVAPAVVARLITAGRTHPMTVIHVSLGALVVGDLGMLTFRPDSSIWWLVVPMLLLGLGFGLPIGLVDGEALASVPAHSSGTAAGVLNLFRIGSEALFVAGYAWLLTILVKASMPNDPRADATAAGIPGFPYEYAHAFHQVAAILAVLVAATAGAAILLIRANDRQKVSSP
ncbi:MFS transporter [Rhodococcoides kyotonense]|uniref:Predicted arabinose efflux permease, MFS family n=1 Tax=Rhodococcoides kyotonense TaxID=398843 RepID=A0A239KL71_9NOCA|nr:MFS transporter [Rhodococcus kyotonensis]SNT18339.1 Predicted arabinose efflux permease, MFS family [Rhodococcus kyotonensis]